MTPAVWCIWIKFYAYISLKKFDIAVKHLRGKSVFVLLHLIDLVLIYRSYMIQTYKLWKVLIWRYFHLCDLDLISNNYIVLKPRWSRRAIKKYGHSLKSGMDSLVWRWFFYLFTQFISNPCLSSHENRSVYNNDNQVSDTSFKDSPDQFLEHTKSKT